MNTIQVEILPDGMAKECNPLGEMPVKSFEACYYASAEHEYLSLLNEWQLAESQRRVFKIVGVIINTVDGKKKVTNVDLKYLIGSIHTAEIVNEKEVMIK